MHKLGYRYRSGANINYVTGHAIFEATHGTAPKYADKDVVNPGSVILSGVMLLEHLGWQEAADLIYKGMETSINNKTVTYDFARLMDGATEVKCPSSQTKSLKPVRRRFIVAITRKKITVVGAGFTGATTALMLAQKELGDVVLLDIPQLENPTKGKALDMLEASPVQGFDSNIVGTSNYEDAANSDIVIITAGVARKPGMSRDDLVNTNAGIVKSVCENVKSHAPNATVIILSNPVDAMTYVAYNTLGFPKNRVIGQSGVLDTARYCTFIAQELNVSVEDVRGFVLGGHGDDMVPLVRYSSVGAFRSTR